MATDWCRVVHRGCIEVYRRVRGSQQAQCPSGTRREIGRPVEVKSRYVEITRQYFHDWLALLLRDMG